MDQQTLGHTVVFDADQGVSLIEGVWRDCKGRFLILLNLWLCRIVLLYGKTECVKVINENR